MKTIVYKKSDLMCVGMIQYGTTFEWEIEHNVIPNFGGVESDYATITTDLDRFHLENIDGVVGAVENGLTLDEQKQAIINQLNELDKIVDRQSERIYEDTNTTPSYQLVIDTIAQKQALRLQLQELGV